ncbi:MAG: SLC13 family permease [Acidobacteriaceae bacterium]
MHLLASHAVLIWIISLAGILCMLLRPWGIREAVWICVAAVLLIAARLLPLPLAARAAQKGSGVYLFLAGMMLLAELARHEGVFDWIADIAVRRSHGSASRLFLLVYCAGIAVTAFLSNDATAVVLTPAILAAVRRARAHPKPYLLACALVANAASFLLPMSNPSNLVVYGGHMPSLGVWLRYFLLPATASIATTYFLLRMISRNALASEIESPTQRISLTPAGRLALAGVIFASIVLLVASGLRVRLGEPTCVAAVAALILVSIKDRRIYKRVILDISWSILPLVAGLFILVEALNTAGLLAAIETAFAWLAHQPALPASLAAATGTALAANAMNNLPVALAAGAALTHTPQLSHAVLIGVNLGPNLSVTGSLATILWLIALRRDGVEITRWEFFKTGWVVMSVALLLSVIALWLVA